MESTGKDEQVCKAAGGGHNSNPGGDLLRCEGSTSLDECRGGDGGAKGRGSLKSSKGGGLENTLVTFSSTLFEQLDEQSISRSGVASPLELIEFFRLEEQEYLFLLYNRL